MRDALIKILERQVHTSRSATLALWRMGQLVNASETEKALNDLVAEGLAASWQGKKGVTHYSTPGGGYSPGGAA